MPNTMLQCPSCHQSSDIFTVFGTLVTGEMSVRIGPNGVVQSAGPIRPKTMVKPGQELKGHFSLTCPHCSHSGRPDTYSLVMTSLLSGKPTQKTITLPCIGIVIAIAEGEEDEAARIFTDAAFTSWKDDARVARLLGLP